MTYGKTIRIYLADGTPTGIRHASGAIVVDGVGIRFKKDTLFTSPSAAAAVVLGGVMNGRAAWKDAQGRSLNALEQAISEGHDVASAAVAVGAGSAYSGNPDGDDPE